MEDPTDEKTPEGEFYILKQRYVTKDGVEKIYECKKKITRKRRNRITTEDITDFIAENITNGVDLSSYITDNKLSIKSFKDKLLDYCISNLASFKMSTEATA